MSPATMTWSTGNFVLNFFSVTIYQEVPKLILQKEFCGSVQCHSWVLWQLGPVITELLNFKKNDIYGISLLDSSKIFYVKYSFLCPICCLFDCAA
jgi:hypothetical protein